MVKFIIANFKYLKYILKHKWYVFLACCKLGIPVRGLLHDMSKFRPSEWFPYLNHFYLSSSSSEAFNKAWLKHIHRNPHHGQYWWLIQDSGEGTTIEIPKKYIKEMVADWIGAGKAITGKDNVIEWYKENAKNMSIRIESTFEIERLLRKLYNLGYEDFIFI